MASSVLLHLVLLVGARAVRAGGARDATARRDVAETFVRIRVSARAASAAEPARAEPPLELAGSRRTAIPPPVPTELATRGDSTLEELFEDASGPASLASRPSTGGGQPRALLGWERGALRRGRGVAAASAVAIVEGPSTATHSQGTASGAAVAPRVVAPVLLVAPPPEYPEGARRRGEEGNVLCRFEVGADGAVTAVEIVESSGSVRLDTAARHALMRWLFRPATSGEQAVAWTVLHTVAFELR